VAIWQRAILSLALCAVFAAPCKTQTLNSDKLSEKSLDAAASFAQSLAQWEFIMIGGSLLLLVGTSYHRPPGLGIRFSYLLFIPAWACLGSSIYFGTRAQEVHLAYLLLPTTTVEGARTALNKDIGSEIYWMWWGLICFSIWLLVYLSWWVFTKRMRDHRGDS